MVENHSFAGRSDEWRAGYEAGIAAFENELRSATARRPIGAAAPSGEGDQCDAFDLLPACKAALEFYDGIQEPHRTGEAAILGRLQAAVAKAEVA